MQRLQSSVVRSLFFLVLCLVSTLPTMTCAAQFETAPAWISDAEQNPRDELSALQEQIMWRDIQYNIALLKSQPLLAEPDATQSVAYGFPLRLAPGLPDYAGFRVSAFVDHDPALGPVLDYNGGTRTYDGHRGTDFALWPFSWNKVDAGDMQVIAAAAGTLAYKANVDPTDHNPCDGGSNNDPWNYVGIVHADGRLTIYGHIRYNSDRQGHRPDGGAGRVSGYGGELWQLERSAYAF